jgi:hypothetical protein
MPRVQVGTRIVEFPDGMSESEMEAALHQLPPEDASAAPTEHPHAKVARLLKENLPAVGGLIGGAVGAAGGPVVAAGAAGLGGAGGRLLQRSIAGDVRDLPEMALDAAQSGATQAALEGVGGIAGRGLAAGGSRLYRGLLKPAKALRQEFPNVVGTLMKIRAPISDRGVARVTTALERSSQQADDLIAAAAPTAAPIQASEIIPEMRETIGTLVKRRAIGQPSALPDVSRRIKALIDASGPGIPLSRAQALKKTAQDAAAQGYRQVERGTVKELAAETMLDADVARGLRKAIEARVPAVAPVNARTQALIGGQRALEEALAREGNTLAFGGVKDLLAGMAASGGYAASGDPEKSVGLGLLIRLLATPATGSRAALAASGLAEPVRVLLPQFLRLLSVSHEPTRQTP